LRHGRFAHVSARDNHATIVTQINKDPNILPNVNLVLRWSDTRGETVEATSAMIDMICDGIVAFFGPEGSCYVEAIVAQSRNIPMISYVSGVFINFEESLPSIRAYRLVLRPASSVSLINVSL